jgi:tyrosine-protein kinase Etk/Wzc
MNRDFIEPNYNREINYSKILGTIFSRWYWIVGCTIITVGMAWAYLSVIHPRYSANASIMINDKKSDISQILNSQGENNSSNSYEAFNLTQSATFIIGSEAFLSKAVARLNYRYSFYVKDSWSFEELYPISPFKIDIIKQDTTSFYSGLFTIVNINNKEFKLAGSEVKMPETIYKYGDLIKAPGLVFKISGTDAEPDNVYYFRFHTKESLVSRAGGTLSIDPQNGNILSLSHTDVNPYFSADVLNAISKEYVIYESYQRRLSATQRLKFIEEQLDTLSNQVNVSATDLENFKKQNGLDNLPAKVQNDIGRIAQLEAQKQQLEVERLAINQLEKQIAANNTKDMLNFNLEGQIGSLLAGLVSKLNDQISERDKKLLTYNVNSSPVLQSDKQIADTKQAIASNITQLRQRNETNQDYFNKQVEASRQSLEGLPSDAKDFINLQTEYTIKQKIFSNLVEERLRSSIALSAIEPGASIIYSATASGTPVWPIANRIYIMGLLAGVGAGLFLILAARYLNGRIRDIGTVQDLTPTPILGLIRKLKKSKFTNGYSEILLLSHESEFTESVRSLRNNLAFLLNKNQDKIICISSEISGEGRSFIAANLGHSLAQLEKKVVIIDADLRKPASDKNSVEEDGLSAYLNGYKSLMEVIRNTDMRNLDIIPSGISPSNPSELIQNSKMEELLGFLQNIYDYIIIDTTPVGVVSDAIPLISKADINLFVLRSGISGFNALSRLEKISSDYKVDNFFIVLNEFKNNPLYQSFYSTTNTSLYFNKDFIDYTKKYNADNDQSRWRRFRQSSN